jgi:two-component system sensor histidine kinase KdpD
MDDARVAAEAERLRGALLTSLSHDLKTPLAAILGAANSLREYGERFDAKERSEMIGTIEEEASRMARFVSNLLDMTRLESGAIELKRQPTDLSDVVGTALRRTETLLADFKVSLDIEPNLPLLELDDMLFEQVLVNLLDNAAKYAPPSSTITVKAQKAGDVVRLQVLDEGVGIPEDQLSLIFEKFHRVKGRDRQRAGTGLGLAICRGFVEAMGGAITAANRIDRSGAVLTVDLPVPAVFETSRPQVLA